MSSLCEPMSFRTSESGRTRVRKSSNEINVSQSFFRGFTSARFALRAWHRCTCAGASALAIAAPTPLRSRWRFERWTFQLGKVRAACATQVVQAAWSSAFFMAAMPCSIMGPTTLDASCGEEIGDPDDAAAVTFRKNLHRSVVVGERASLGAPYQSSGVVVDRYDRFLDHHAVGERDDAPKARAACRGRSRASVACGARRCHGSRPTPRVGARR